MKYLQYLVSVLGTAVVLSLAINNQPVQAQVAYGRYLYRFWSCCLSYDTQLGGILAFRYKLLETPVSFRTQALIGKGTAIVPTVSYDLPLNWQTDVYLGAGMVLTSCDSACPVGNKISFTLQPGTDYVVPNSNTRNGFCSHDYYV
jgi:hypothetical protein